MAAPDPVDLLLPTSALLFAHGVALLFEPRAGRDDRRTPDPRDGEPRVCACRPPRGIAAREAVEPSRPTIQMTQAVYSRVLGHLLRTPPEAGGALVGPRDCELVTHYLPNQGESTEVSFTLDHKTLNRQLAALREAGLDVKGLVHSHPTGAHSPSSGDRRYLERLLGNPKNQDATAFAFPIVCDGRLWPYAAVRVGRDEIAIRHANLTLV